MIHFKYTVSIGRSVHMSILLYVHRKKDDFSVSHFPSQQGSTPLSLIHYLSSVSLLHSSWCHNLSYLAGKALDQKNPDLNYLATTDLLGEYSGDLKSDHSQSNLFDSKISNGWAYTGLSFCPNHLKPRPLKSGHFLDFKWWGFQTPNPICEPSSCSTIPNPD